ncbi:MAG TPA: hypothetical protein VJS88_00100, partial [Chthoniobacterales bacterium]|nr:hypothetical protein [Chthoniobacterales bacterium]
MKTFRRALAVFIVGALASAAPLLSAAPVRVTTWNLEWFPNGSKKELPPAQQEQRIATAADVLRPLDSDIIL